METGWRLSKPSDHPLPRWTSDASEPSPVKARAVAKLLFFWVEGIFNRLIPTSPLACRCPKGTLHQSLSPQSPILLVIQNHIFADRNSRLSLFCWDPEPTAATEGWPKQLGSPPGGIQTGTTRISPWVHVIHNWLAKWSKKRQEKRTFKTSTVIPFRGRLNILFSSSGDQTFFSFGRVVLQLWQTQEFSGSLGISGYPVIPSRLASQFSSYKSVTWQKKVNGEQEQPFQNQLFVCWTSLPSCTLFNWCNVENPRIWHEISTKLFCCFGMQLRKYPARNKNNTFVVDSSAWVTTPVCEDRTRLIDSLEHMRGLSVNNLILPKASGWQHKHFLCKGKSHRKKVVVVDAFWNWPEMLGIYIRDTNKKIWKLSD